MGNADKTILVVDDSSTMRRILVNTLNRLGFTQVVQAGNGVEALAECDKARFDCVMTDWNMPEMEGLELVTRLRKMADYQKTPIIMVTTEGGKSDVLEALTRGVTDYVVKPFTPDVIKAKMDRAFPA
jgi:two-component system, chemotaxis family, chemotaxis protein CheY